MAVGGDDLDEAGFDGFLTVPVAVAQATPLPRPGVAAAALQHFCHPLLQLHTGFQKPQALHPEHHDDPVLHSQPPLSPIEIWGGQSKKSSSRRLLTVCFTSCFEAC